MNSKDLDQKLAEILAYYASRVTDREERKKIQPDMVWDLEFIAIETIKANLLEAGWSRPKVTR